MNYIKNTNYSDDEEFNEELDNSYDEEFDEGSDNIDDVEINETPQRKKNIFHNFLISFLAMSACVGVGVSAYYIYQTFKPDIINYDTTQQRNFIRERTMSMTFETFPHDGKIQQTFGTTWIIGQDSVDKNKFYMATNMHVIAGAIIASNNDLTLSTNYSSKYSINKKYINNVKLSFPNPKNPHFINSGDNDLIDEKFTSTFFPTVEYVATSYNKYDYGPSKILVPYSMSDLAILGFNCSSATQDFKDYLSFNYLKSPTKFALNPAGPLPTNDYFVGGYPFNNSWKKGVWKFDDSYNDSKTKRNAIDIMQPNFSVGNLTIDSAINSYPKPTKIHGSSTGTIFPLYIDYAKTQSPEFKYENYAFQNVSEQIVISNLDLGGGSSGSMAINKDNEVVGIYWGAYTSTSKSSGAFDSFISYKYNLLKDIKTTIKTISNGNWDQV